jgi:ubiquinone/menaquinone biosynthesis C-methylase UbiE
MGVGKKKRKNHILGFKEEIEKASKGNAQDFFNWFDESGGDIDTNYIKGQCEFILYILMPILNELKDSKNKTALEIGYGGGRLLAAASFIFAKVIGVDIHNNMAAVKEEFQKRSIKNYQLQQNDGKTIPIKNSSVDLVYSFIVLQHVENIEILQSYLKETYRVLNNDGLAVLYFGRLYRISHETNSKVLYKIDQILEKIHPKGYSQVLAKVNYTNLKVSLGYAKELSRQAGFSIIDEGVCKKLPDLNEYSGQHYLVLKKKTQPETNIR